MSEGSRSYLRQQALPTVWCPGCGNGVIVKALLEAVDGLGWSKDDVVVVGGIGCSGRTPFILDFNTMHTLHGRALAFATGVKLANPNLKVIVAMGDGDCSAIGGNHFIHACRRNIDMTAIVFNNGIYGQTGGQQAPTTPTGKRSTTSVNGALDVPFDISGLGMAAGAGFVARSTSYDYKECSRFIRRALEFKGFSMVEIMTACPTYFGRMNEMREPHEMLLYLRDTSSPLSEEEERQLRDELQRVRTGILKDEPRAEYIDKYRAMCNKL